MDSNELKRYLPVAGIIAVLLVIAIALLGGSGDSKDKTRANVARTSTKKKAVTKTAVAPTGATAQVTPQSTTKVTGPHDDPVPILMYHVTKAAPAGTPYPDLWVSPGDFKDQMNWLADNGYTGVTMAQLFKYWDDGYKLPAKPVVISFDDGYPSHEEVARPVLAQHKWPGVLFLELNNVDNPETGFKTSMVKKLLASGWEIGSHTISHPDLTTVDASQLKTEVTDSRAQISKKFGVPIDFFCYPAGKYNDAVVAAVKDAGYKGATTVDEGLGKPSEPFKLKRIRIDGSDGVEGFASKIRSAQQ